MIAVTDVFDAMFGAHLFRAGEQRFAEHVLWGDGVPALGVGQQLDQRQHGFANGTVGRHRPAKGRGVAVLAGDLIGPHRRHEHTAHLAHFLGHRQC
ncbi:hypothetical protein D3C86_1634470 [compost metagenome]